MTQTIATHSPGSTSLQHSFDKLQVVFIETELKQKQEQLISKYDNNLLVQTNKSTSVKNDL